MNSLKKGLSYTNENLLVCNDMPSDEVFEGSLNHLQNDLNVDYFDGENEKATTSRPNTS